MKLKEQYANCEIDSWDIQKRNQFKEKKQYCFNDSEREICQRRNFFRRVSTDLQEYFIRGIVRKLQ